VSKVGASHLKTSSLVDNSTLEDIRNRPAKDEFAAYQALTAFSLPCLSQKHSLKLSFATEVLSYWVVGDSTGPSRTPASTDTPPVTFTCACVY